MYLSPNQLAELISCEPTSYACMRRWLNKYNWPFATNLLGFPMVSKKYHDSKLNGTSTEKQFEQEPDFGALR